MAAPAVASPLCAQQPRRAAPRDTLPRPDTGAVVALAPLTVRVLGPVVPLLQAPYGVSVVDAPRHAPGSTLSLRPLLRGVPGVQVDDRHNPALGDRISIRGFGARSQFGVRGVAVLLDGIPVTLPDGQTTLSVVDPAFLAGAQVLRGPASALYGNAAGGAILLESRAPPVHGSDAALTVAGGADALRRGRLDIGTAWTGGGLRAQLSRVLTDGYRRHARADVSRGQARARLGAGGGTLELSLDGTTYHAQNPGSLSDSAMAADPRAAYPLNVAQATGERAHQAQLGARWARPLGPATRLEALAWARTRTVVNPIPFTIIDLDRRLYGGRVAVTRELAGLGVTAGAQSALQDDDRRNAENDGGQPGTPTLDQNERVGSLALFARVRARLTPRLGAMAALRYDHFGFRVRDRLVGPGEPDDSGRRGMRAWSPTLAAHYDVAAGLTLYANGGTSFETPTTSELANRPGGAGGFNPELQPQRTTSVEAGAKGVVAGRLRYDVAFYSARVRDALIPFEVPGAPGRQYFRNAGSARHRGAEVELDLAASRALMVHAAYTWLDARFRDYVVDGENLAGKRIPGVAPRRLDASAALHAAGLRQTLTLTYVAATFVDDRNTARSPAYAVIDYRVAAPRLPGGGSGITPFVAIDNLLDRTYAGSVVVNAFGGRYYEPAPGRTLTLGVDLRLGRAAGPGARGER